MHTTYSYISNTIYKRREFSLPIIRFFDGKPNDRPVQNTRRIRRKPFNGKWEITLFGKSKTLFNWLLCGTDTIWTQTIVLWTKGTRFSCRRHWLLKRKNSFIGYCTYIWKVLSNLSIYLIVKHGRSLTK